MLSSSTGFILALVPVLAYAQNVYTTTVVVNGVQRTLTETFKLAPEVVTRTIIITAPADQITSIIETVPKSVQLQPSDEPGQTVPITIHGYVTSIVIPASASVPTAITLSPITPVIPAPTNVQSAVSNSVNIGVGSVSSVLASGMYRSCSPSTSKSTQ